MGSVDVVVVSYNSRDHLRQGVEPLAALGGVRVLVVDNASADGTLETIADLPVEAVPLQDNGGFAHGCNIGWRLGHGSFVLFLNPDATIDAGSLDRLVRLLVENPTAGIAAPKIVHSSGDLHFSQRRFPRLRSTYGQALFLHRVLPHAAWTDELVRDESAYTAPGSPEWVSGACMLVRRDLLARLDGMDEGFFMYCEDTDLCRRVRSAGYDVRFEPDALVVHEGGASAPRASLLPVLAASRVRYSRKHRGRAIAALDRLGIALGAVTHMIVARGGAASRAGHARALRLVASRLPTTAPSRTAREA
jgi:N-acetylglucosaminyl-diphospho-decaprenol L-rhamnosyltransferase